MYGPLRLVSSGPIFTWSNRVVLTTGYLGRHVQMGADLSDYSVQRARLPVSSIILVFGRQTGRVHARQSG